MKVIKFIARFLAWFLLGIIALVAIVLIAIQTPVVKKKIVEIAEKQVNNILEGELSVGKLEGNFFTNLRLQEVLLRSTNQDTIALVPEIRLNYSLLPLLRQKIVVGNLVLENPYVHLYQLSDSTWNLQHIVKPSDNPNDTASSTFNFQIQVDKFSLNNGLVKIDAFNQQIPRTIQNLGIDLSGLYSTEKQVIDLTRFELTALQPDINLSALNLQAEGDKKAIVVTALLLKTLRNQIELKGEYNFSTDEKSYAQINTLPIILDEFKEFLPEGFKLGAEPILNLNAELEKKNLTLKALLKDSLQEIDLQVLSYQLLEYFSDSTISPVTFDLALDLKKIDLRHWLDNPELNYQINGLLTAKGEGLDPESMRADIKGNFGNIILYSNPVEKLDIQASYLAGNVDGRIEGRGNFGSLSVIPKAQQILSKNPRYQVQVNTRHLDVSPILGNKQYKTDLNLDAQVKGSGFELDRINANSLIVMKPSSAMGIKIDTLHSQIDYANQNLLIHELLLETMSIHLLAGGNYNLKGASDIQLEATVDNAREIARFAGLEDFQTSAKINARLIGEPDNLDADATIGIGKTRYQDFRLDTLYATANAKMQNKAINANADLHVNRFTGAGLSLDDIHLQAQTDMENYNLSLNAGGRDLKAQLNGLIQIKDAINVVLSDLLLDYKGYAWQQVSDTAFISVSDTEYEVRNFHLVLDSVDFSQSILADGKVSRVGEQDLKLDINNLDVGQLMKVFAPEQKVEGIANFNMNLVGNALSPRLTGVLRVDSTVLQDYRFDSIRGNINLENDELAVNLDIVPQSIGTVHGEGRLPVSARLDSMKFKFIPADTDPVYARLLIDRLPLSILSIFLPADEIKGEINSHLNVDGTMKQPDISGDLKIKDGKLKINQYGVDYRNIQTDIQIMRDAVNVDTFLIQSHDGNMTAQGNVKFNSELYNADLSSSELSILFKRFNPFDHKQFNMELSGNVDLNATADSVLFSGDLVIPEANIYLPAVMNLLGQFSTPNIPKPLLVVELERIEGDSLIYQIRPDKETAKNDTAKNRFAFMNNLQGAVKVEIPRNTWIRNDDMRIELSGDVELMKHRDFFELFGTIDVVRGQYNLLGKVFVIQTGTVTFQGGEKINPMLNVEATYTFRDTERNKRDLTVLVTGEMLSPELKFTLEGQDISEGDALSYILFGMNMDALTSGQQSSLNSTMDATGLAEMAAASLISSQLTKFLGNTLNVDYIEFKAGSSFDNASFTVGKYITNKLFVSYEQYIGTIEETDIARYEVTLEYEIFKFLFIQLASSPITNGFDVIFKINSDTFKRK